MVGMDSLSEGKVLVSLHRALLCLLLFGRACLVSAILALIGEGEAADAARRAAPVEQIADVAR